MIPPDYQAVMASPLPGGVKIGLRCSATTLDAVDFLPARFTVLPPVNAFAARVAAILAAYFEDPVVPLRLPVAPGGTPYQQRVWEALREIAPGRTAAYGEVAGWLGSGARAVAAACRANPIPLVIPCHRVVGARGVGGYMGAVRGAPLEIKQWLLRHEGALGRRSFPH